MLPNGKEFSKSAQLPGKLLSLRQQVTLALLITQVFARDKLNSADLAIKTRTVRFSLLTSPVPTNTATIKPSKLIAEAKVQEDFVFSRSCNFWE